MHRLRKPISYCNIFFWKLLASIKLYKWTKLMAVKKKLKHQATVCLESASKTKTLCIWASTSLYMCVYPGIVMPYHFYRSFITAVWRITVGAVFVFSLKYILFHAMKQIANVCYFYYYGCTTPSTPVEVVSVFPWKKIVLFMYLFLFYDCLS